MQFKNETNFQFRADIAQSFGVQKLISEDIYIEIIEKDQ